MRSEIVADAAAVKTDYLQCHDGGLKGELEMYTQYKNDHHQLF